MMTVPMDSSLSSWEFAQRLYDKNVELENGLRLSAKSKVPSDPNAWLQMRENYEAIILEDRDFSEKKDIEFVLWQLHYRRIEEFRQHINAAVSDGTGSNLPAGRKVLVHPDKIKKIHYVFRSFLTEATGFYHDLILKIRAKYGLPLSYFNEGIETEIVSMKDEKNLSEMQKGLVSCHRCLIYLGDLARYKGLYGEGDSVSRDFAAASSYYLQAVSLYPSSGNPHHQLAILASYSADELLSVYRYFRSLAVEIPFSTARDNLIIAFEKNRQSFSQLPGNMKVVSGRKMRMRSTGRGRGRGDLKLMQKDTKIETSHIKDQKLTKSELFKAFSIRFVRLHGILFTRTSLETFGEVFGSVINDLIVLLSSGPQEELNFGSTGAENSLTMLRLISIMIFTVHNVKRESENQSYAEILQRRVLLQNAFTSAFKFAGYILKRCVELQDSASSYLLPGILLFIEWLACHQDIAASSDMEEKEEGARLFFWDHCISFMNKLIETGLASIDGDDDEACFFNMSRYDGEETGNRLALWEDFELRGFLPLVPAQLILDFSRKHPLMNDGGMKDSVSRVQRILAAGRALSNIVYIEQKKLYIDPNRKKFVLSSEPPVFDGNMDPTFQGLLDSGVKKQGSEIKDVADLWAAQRTSSLGVAEIKDHIYMGGEDDEEEIVFKPPTSEKYADAKLTAFNLINPVQEYFLSDQAMPARHLSPNFGQINVPALPNNEWFSKQEACLSNGIKNMNITENGHLNKQVLQESSTMVQPQPFSHVLSTSVNLDADNTFSNQITAADVVLPSAFDTILPSGAISDGLAMKPSGFPTLKKSPVSRPVRYAGPPPGFSHISSRQQNGGIPNSCTNDQLHEIDDYSWLDTSRSSTKSMGVDNSFDKITHRIPCINTSNTTPFATVSTFPFPGKQVSNVQSEIVDGRRWHDFQLFEQLKPFNVQQNQHSNPQQTLLPEQYKAQSLWSNQYFV
ncbi:protein SMG7-like [Zingiber officinale]|uniref:protein SMG7-like n=1 Tax=Zingiber officinale TaxID=94328 RepID=UPI001C4D7F4F|nr:protein SMG7-like [Zingiber officinale]XP_042399857.1 protein SMG7-like [Zingiber officinale]XP_042399858.1 protein SMG7-like [Zingiber officinale]XP_042399859.1 protein SMG7-like [Zingiber officinale]XP_042399860.1 protein SMG7-like [Zingiber officinale]